MKQQNLSFRNRLFAHFCWILKDQQAHYLPSLKKSQNSTYPSGFMLSTHPLILLVVCDELAELEELLLEKLEELKFPILNILSWCLQQQSSLKSSKTGRVFSKRRPSRQRILLHVCLQRRCESEWAVHLFTRPRSHVRWRHNFLCTLETAEILSVTANRQCTFTLKSTIHL